MIHRDKFKITLLLFSAGIMLSANIFAEEEFVKTKSEAVKGFTMTLVDKNGKEKAIISGSVANMLPEGLVEIMDVAAKVIDPKNKTVEAIIHSSQGIYNRILNIINTDKFVRINRNNMVVTGTGLFWQPDKSELVIQNNVRVEYVSRREVADGLSDAATGLPQDNLDKEEVAATVITAEGTGRLRYQDQAVAVFKKNVVLNDKDTCLKARLMKIFFDKNTQNLTQVEAYGNVRIKQPARESSCRKAVYYVAEDKVVLLGKPEIAQGLDLYTAKKITVYDKGKRVVFEPRAELVIYAGTEHSEFY